MKAARFLFSILQSKQKNQFRMEWEGNKIPDGATINGIEIGWTQHGIITGTGGEELGYYKREVEFGGENRMTHVMIIGTDYSDITPPPGGKVEPFTPQQGKAI